jgi:hypothetical protein
MIQTTYWLKDDTEDEIKKNNFFWRVFARFFQDESNAIFQNLLQFFHFEVISIWIKEVKKEVAKTDLKTTTFCNSYFHLFDANAYKIQTKNCRRFSKMALNLLWKKSFKNSFKKELFFFILCSVSSFSQYAVCIIFSFPIVLKAAGHPLQTLITSEWKIVEDFQR